MTQRLFLIRPVDGERVYFNDFHTHAEGPFVQAEFVAEFYRQAFAAGFVGTPHPEDS